MNIYWLEQRRHEQRQQMTQVQVPPGSSHWTLFGGRRVAIPPSHIIEVTQEELAAVLRNGGKRVG
jgi:hypothetical protein